MPPTGEHFEQRQTRAMTENDLASALFRGCREQLREVLDAGMSGAFVEHAIESFPLGREKKSALWLWAHAQGAVLNDDPSENPIITDWPTQRQMLSARALSTDDQL